MKVNFSSDEWYPLYDFVSADTPKRMFDYSAELTVDELSDFQRVMKEFKAWQHRLQEITE